MLTELDYRALEAIRDQPGISGQNLVYAMGLKREGGHPYRPQGAARVGASRGIRLRKQGLVQDGGMGRGWRLTWAITDKGRRALAARASANLPADRDPQGEPDHA